MAGKLSFAQELALIALHRGASSPIDSRARRGLVVRGLIETGSWPNYDVPRLTVAGLRIAAELDAEARRVCSERRMRGSRFGVIDGVLG